MKDAVLGSYDHKKWCLREVLMVLRTMEGSPIKHSGRRLKTVARKMKEASIHFRKLHKGVRKVLLSSDAKIENRQ